MARKMIAGRGKKADVKLVDLTESARILAIAHVHSPLPFVISRVDGRFSYTNQAFCELTGYTEGELRAKTWADLAPEDTLDDAQMIREQLKAGQVPKVRKDCFRKDGSRVPVEILLHQVWDERGALQFIYAFISDITGRKLVEEALRESEQRYRLMAENAADFIYIIDRDNRVKYVNRASAAALSMSQGDVVGRHLETLFPPETYAHMKSSLAEVFEGGKPASAELVHKFYQGDYHIHVVLTPLVDDEGRVSQVLGISRDITELKRAEDILRKHEKELLLSQQIAHVGSWTWVIDTNKNRWSDEMYRICGLEPQEGELDCDLFFSMIHPEDKERVEKACIEYIQGNEPYSVDFRIIRADGTVRYVHSESRNIVRDERGKPVEVFGIAQDITERRQAEKTIKESEASLSRAQKIARLGSWEWDLATNRVRWSDEMYRIFGYAPRQFEVNFEKVRSFVHPDDAEAWKRSVDAALYKGARHTVDYRIVLPDGSMRIVHADGELAYVAGRPARMYGTVQDVTERKQAEAALRESEEKYRHIVETTNEGIAVFDTDFRITYANDRMADMLGYPLDEVLGRLAYHFIDESWIPVVYEKLGRTKPGRVDRFEMKCKRKDGSILWTLTSGKAFYDVRGNFSGALSFHTDNTEHKHDESERERLLRELYLARERLLTILQHMPAGVIIAEAPSGKMIMGNDQVERIWRHPFIPSEEIKDYQEYMGFHLDGRSLKPEEWPLARSIVNGETVNGEEIKFMRGDGTYGIMRVSSAPIHDHAGNIVAGVVTFDDISDLKQIEGQLRVAKGQVELYLDLMGHDIRNMHQVAMGYIELASDTLQLNGEQKEFLDRPYDVLKRSSTIIDNVRKLQMINRGEISPHIVDLGQMLRDIKSEHDEALQKEITLDCRPGGQYLVAANELLRDVFSNLVNNAVKHSGRDDVAISIALEPTDAYGTRAYRVAVEDNGPGISDGMKERIFDRLQRGPTLAKGAGLGLYLVKALVDSYNGRVWVEDRVQGDHTKGSRFVIVLPAYTEGTVDSMDTMDTTLLFPRDHPDHPDHHVIGR